MVNLETTTAELLALIGQLTVENRILRQTIASLEAEALASKPKPKPAR